MSAAVWFLGFLAGFAVLGAASAVRSRGTVDDYYLASKDVPPWLAGLSAVASNNSGYMFIGMIGATYLTGWSSVWLMLGWIAGDMGASYLVWKRLRNTASRDDVGSYSQLLSRWQGEHFPTVRRLAAILTLVFLCVYAAAQLKAGGKALHAVFNWRVESGAIAGAIIVVIYSIAGGIRASIWTDAAQSFVMLGAMVMLMIVGVDQAGGWSLLWGNLTMVEPGYMDWFDGEAPVAAIMMVVSWLFAGVAVLGQPHIVVRFMSFNDVKHIRQVRVWYYGWYVLFYSVTIIVGLVTRLLLPEIEGFDAELALPRLAQDLLPPPLVGLVLAGLFAATMSTADSLVLACSAAVSVDLVAGPGSLKRAKMATLAIVVISFLISVSGNKTVFQMVLDAWGTLGASFAPLILLYAAGRRFQEMSAVATVLTGTVTFAVWSWTGLSSQTYGVFPAIAASLVVGLALSRAGQADLADTRISAFR